MFRINRAWSTPVSVLSVDAKLEKSGDNWSEALFISINHYKKSQVIKMLFDAHSLRSMVYGLRELHADKSSYFKKYTKSAEFKKELSIGYANKRFYINMVEGNTKVEHIFGAYSLLAFADTLLLMCDEVEKALFRAQSKGGDNV